MKGKGKYVYHVPAGSAEARRRNLIPWKWTDVSWHVGAGIELVCSARSKSAHILFFKCYFQSAMKYFLAYAQRMLNDTTRSFAQQCS